MSYLIRRDTQGRLTGALCRAQGCGTHIDATTDRQLTAAKASHTEMHRAALVGKEKP